MLTDEGMRNAAARAESAAEGLRYAAGHADEVATRLERIFTDGYGSNALKLIELIEQINTDRTIKAATRELLCQRCSQEYPVWFTNNKLWHAVAKDGEHFFCLNCFVFLAEERGIVRASRWHLEIS